jgi:hypothetical protein
MNFVGVTLHARSYMLFAVDSEENPKEPQAKPEKTADQASEKKS